MALMPSHSSTSGRAAGGNFQAELRHFGVGKVELQGQRFPPHLSPFKGLAVGIGAADAPDAEQAEAVLAAAPGV